MTSSPAGRPWTVRGPTPSLAEALPPLDTRYSFTWTDAEGMIAERVRMGPSVAAFTDAFAALGRGALIQTPDGPVAVEDLLPGDMIVTGRGALPLRWKGSRVIAPRHHGIPLYRITAEALGPARPGLDLVLGPAARVVTRQREGAALMPIAMLEDSETVIRIRPVSPLQVFHLGFDGHATVTANGVDLDSVHPGALAGSLGPEMTAIYLSMFPHIERFDNFGDLALPRLPEALAQATKVA